jgi:hypothetical protein
MFDVKGTDVVDIRSSAVTFLIMIIQKTWGDPLFPLETLRSLVRSKTTRDQTTGAEEGFGEANRGWKQRQRRIRVTGVIVLAIIWYYPSRVKGLR